MRSAGSPDEKLLGAALERLATRLSALLDVPMAIDGLDVGHAWGEDMGTGDVHVAFRFSVGECDGVAKAHTACLLIPQVEAKAMAAYLMMMPVKLVRGQRRIDLPDASMRDALRELGSYCVRAIDAALRSATYGKVTAHGLTCLGVPAGVCPVPGADVAGESTGMLVARAQTQLADFDPFEMILVMPHGCGVSGTAV